MVSESKCQARLQSLAGYVPLELAAGAFLSLGEGLADFAGDPPFSQKMRSSHIHTCIQGIVKLCQVLPKLYPSCVCVVRRAFVKKHITWTDKVQRSTSIRHTDPPAVPCTSLQPAALLLQAAVLEPLPHDFQDNLGIRKYAYSADWPTGTWSSYVMKLWISCKKTESGLLEFQFVLSSCLLCKSLCLRFKRLADQIVFKLCFAQHL